MVPADLFWALAVTESHWNRACTAGQTPQLGTHTQLCAVEGILRPVSVSGHCTAAEEQQHKLATKLSPNLCDTWLFQPVSSFECPTYLSAAPFYHRHPPPRAFCRPSATSFPPAPISVVPTSMILSEFNAVNSNFHVKCLFFTHQLNVCKSRVFVAESLASVCFWEGRCSS